MKKDKKSYNTKELEFKAMDIDEGSRRVKGMLSAFNVIDSDRDLILRGAFAKSINDRGPKSVSNRKIAYLWSHDILQPIGKFLELEETDEGLLFVAEMGRSTIAQDSFLNYQDGIIKEHSIGFQYCFDKMNYVDPYDAEKRGYKDGFFEISELKLFEGSAVIFGANEFTPTLEVAKGETVVSRRDAIEGQVQSVIKAIRDGKGTDNRLQFLDIFLEQLTTKYRSLLDIASKPSEKDSLRLQAEPRKEVDTLQQFFKGLN